MVNQVVLVIIILLLFAAIGGIVYYLWKNREQPVTNPAEQKYLQQRDFWITKAIEEGEGRGKWYFSPMTGYICVQHEQRGQYSTLEQCNEKAEKAKPVVQLGDSCNANVKCFGDFVCHDQICKKEAKKGDECADRLIKCVNGTMCGPDGLCVKVTN